jgi:uncharacterized protein (TIGR03382 family)
MRRIALVVSVVAALAGIASANGRAPGTSTINFRQGHEQDIAAGMTFGLLISHDGGATWNWMCETAVGYGGLWDPDYAYSPTGALFATTFDGLKVMRNGCTFDSTPPGNKFVSTDQLGSDGSLLFASVDAHDDMIYKSTDDGMTFPAGVTPPGAMLNDWYTNLYIVPTDASKVWIAAYRFSGSTKTLYVYKSTNGGASFSSVTVNGITPFGSQSALSIEGVDGAGNVYARLTYPQGQLTDVIYKLAPNGTSWTQILSKPDTIAFLVRSNGDLVAGTKTQGAFVSTNQGGTWTALTNPPHINCLAENSAHEVWACTQNYGDTTMSIPSDGFGIMKTTDLATWTGVLKYENIAGPVTCDAGTPQQDSCVKLTWCGVRMQLGITANPVDCSALGMPDGAPDAGTVVHPPKKGSSGWCDSGSGAATPAVVGLLLAGVLLRRRKRC